MRNLVKVILPCLAAALRRPGNAVRPQFTAALTCVRSIVDFTLMAQYNSHTEETIGYLRGYLNAFHDSKDIFKEFPIDKVTSYRVREVKKRLTAENLEA